MFPELVFLAGLGRLLFDAFDEVCPFMFPFLPFTNSLPFPPPADENDLVIGWVVP